MDVMAFPTHAQRRRSSVPLVAIGAVAGVVIVAAVALALPTGSDAATDTSTGAAPPVTSPTPVEPASALQSAEPVQVPSPPPPPPPTVEFTLVTGGDVLTHMPVVNSAQAAGGGEYDFSALMEGVRPYVEGADLSICHLEVPVVPEGVSPSGYPMFGAPPKLVEDLAAEGWDGCTTASNHSVDRRFAGIEATLNALNQAGMGQAGMARSEEEAHTTQMYNVRQGERTIQVANISFTYGLNGLSKPEGMPWAVNTFDADAQDVSPILAAAEQARDQGADVVIASTHCCVEYQIQPNAAQRSIVEQIGQSGLVDLYVGHHAHVPQPIELVEGGVHGEGMWAYFGHGNYLSNQGPQCCVAITNSGFIGVTTISVDADGRVDVEPAWVATTVDRANRHAMYALAEIVDAGAPGLSASEAQTRHARVADAVGDQAPELTSPPTPLADAAYAVLRTGG